jgi:nucleoside-diphosphate-sugar epimerase
MRVFVTGGTGFLGRRVVRHLLQRGLEVRCLARPSSDVETLRQSVEPEQAGALEICTGSLNRADSYARALEGCDVVFHVAAAMTGATAVLFLNNVVATRDLLRLSRGAGVRRFVLVSSLGVYGTAHLPAGGLLDESCPLDPNPHLRDAYSYSKIAEEKAAWEAHREGGLPLVVIRPGVIYGPGRGFLSSRVGLRLGKVMARMGGGQELPYTFVDNCAAAVALAGSAPGVEGEAFNVIDDELPTGRDLLRRYRRGVEPLRVLPVPRWAIVPLARLCEGYHRWSAGQLPAVLTPYKSLAQWKPLRYVNAKAKARLGWRPETSLAEGLGQTLDCLGAQVAGSRRLSA